MTTTGVVWPAPKELFDWLGELHLSRDGQTQRVTAVEANAVHAAYSQWLEDHRGACTELESLKKEVTTMKEELTKSQERTNRLIDESLLRTPASQGAGTPVVHRIKPRQPSPFDGSQDLEIVKRFLDEVEHYVRQGASACPSATLDNQLIDTVWRFLSVKTFRWFELEMSRHGILTIPPANHDYGITWKSVKEAFKAQFVPVVAVSVVRKQWHALKFSRNEVLTFNRRGTGIDRNSWGIFEDYTRLPPLGGVPAETPGDVIKGRDTAGSNDTAYQQARFDTRRYDGSCHGTDSRVPSGWHHGLTCVGIEP